MAETFKLQNGQLFVVASAAGGVLNGDQLRSLATLCDSETAFLKLTEDGSVGFMLDESRLEEVRDQLNSTGLLLQHFRCDQAPAVRACLGEICPHHEQDTLGHSLEVTSFLHERFGSETGSSVPYLRIALNGCARNCLASGTDDIHIVAENNGYKIQVGGKASEIPSMGHFLCENVAPEELGEVLAGIIAKFMTDRQDNETLFDLIERCGVGLFESVVPSLASNDGTTQPESATDNLPDTGDGDLSDVDWEHVEVDTTQMPQGSKASDDTTDPVFSASDLDDHTLELGTMDASALTAMTFGSWNHAEPKHSHESKAALDMLADEEGLEAQEATEDDVTRITLSMRSESELEHAAEDREASQGEANSKADVLLPRALLSNETDSSFEDPNDLSANTTDAGQDDDATLATGDIAPSFLQLQERATQAGALQIRTIEDVLSVSTPEGLQLHLPIASLREGLKICLALGGENLECWTGDEKIHLKLGPTCLTIPLPSSAGHGAPHDQLAAA